MMAEAAPTAYSMPRNYGPRVSLLRKITLSILACVVFLVALIGYEFTSQEPSVSLFLSEPALRGSISPE